jgi:hypothetical protein
MFIYISLIEGSKLHILSALVFYACAQKWVVRGLDIPPYDLYTVNYWSFMPYHEGQGTHC